MANYTYTFTGNITGYIKQNIQLKCTFTAPVVNRYRTSDLYIFVINLVQNFSDTRYAH